MKEIWIIRVMDAAYFSNLTGGFADVFGRSHKIGYYLDKEEAVQDILNNSNDIAEGGTNPFVVLYPLAEGVPFAFCEDFSKEVWFHFVKDTDKFERIEYPIQRSQIILD